jgi:hypothetical protein
VLPKRQNCVALDGARTYIEEKQMNGSTAYIEEKSAEKQQDKNGTETARTEKRKRGGHKLKTGENALIHRRGHIDLCEGDLGRELGERGDVNELAEELGRDDSTREAEEH